MEANRFSMCLALLSGIAGEECCWAKGSGLDTYEVPSNIDEKDGGAGARGIRYDDSEAATRGVGWEVRFEDGHSPLAETMEAGRDGKSCATLSELDVFCRMRGGRCCIGGVPRSTLGDPTRSAEGT
jgi:hypothetical protein